MIQVPKEEANLLLLGARVLIDCPDCKTRFSAEPNQILSAKTQLLTTSEH